MAFRRQPSGATFRSDQRASQPCQDRRPKVFGRLATHLKHGKWVFNIGGGQPAWVKLHGFLTTMRLEVGADLHQSTLPIFDSARHPLFGDNGVTIDKKTGQLTPTRPSMLNTKILGWPIHEWEHPRAAAYRQVVSDIIAHWANNRADDPWRGT